MSDVAIEFQLNGKPRSLEKEGTLIVLLEELGFAGRPVLVEHNGIALLTNEHGTTMVRAGDKIELIQIVAGG